MRRDLYMEKMKCPPEISGKVVLIGQAPGSGDASAGPLRGGRSGKMIVKLAGLIDETWLPRVFDLRNLLHAYPGRAGEKGDAFPASLAAEAANAMRAELSGRMVVFLGRGVSRAFGFPKLAPFEIVEAGGLRAAMIPHPSPVNRFWNSERNRIAGGRFLGGLVRDSEWR